MSNNVCPAGEACAHTNFFQQKPLTLPDAVGFLLSCVDHFLILGITLVMCWKCLQMKLVKTAFHAFTCTLGFVFLSAEGFMVRYSRNILSSHLSAENKHILHYTLLLLGGLLGMIGTVQKMWGKKKHFTTLHGKYGIAACVLAAFNFVLGAATYWGLERPPFVHFFHNIIGLLGFSSALISQYYGYNTGFFKRNFNSQDLFRTATVIVFILTLAGPLQIFLRKYLLVS